MRSSPRQLEYLLAFCHFQYALALFHRNRIEESQKFLEISLETFGFSIPQTQFNIHLSTMSQRLAKSVRKKVQSKAVDLSTPTKMESGSKIDESGLFGSSIGLTTGEDLLGDDLKFNFEVDGSNTANNGGDNGGDHSPEIPRAHDTLVRQGSLKKKNKNSTIVHSESAPTSTVVEENELAGERDEEWVGGRKWMADGKLERLCAKMFTWLAVVYFENNLRNYGHWASARAIAMFQSEYRSNGQDLGLVSLAYARACLASYLRGQTER
jgi:hypothetical protein